MASKKPRPATAIVVKSATEIEAPKIHPCACGNYEIEIWTGDVPDGADPNDFVGYIGTGCTSQTTRIFAPGHDAKLKSLLIRAGASGDGVRTQKNGMASTNTADHWADFYGFGAMVRHGIEREQAKRKAASVRDFDATLKAEWSARKGAERTLARYLKTKKGAAMLSTVEGQQAYLAGALEAGRKRRGLDGPAPTEMDLVGRGRDSIVNERNVWNEDAQPCAVEGKIKIGRWEYPATIEPNGNATYSTSAGETKTVESGKYKLVVA